MPINLKPQKNAAVRTVFVEKGTEAAAADGIVDVVLGPSLYWFRERTLPAKNVSDARKLTPSVFDAVIPPGEYSYFVTRNGNGNYWLFAYDETVIAEALKQAGLRGGDIRNLYFAQTECLPMPAPLRVGSRSVLAETDGVVTLLPAGYAAEASDLADFLASRPRSEYRVPVNLYRNDVLDRRSTRTLTAVAGIFALIYGINYVMAGRQLSAVTSQQESLARTYRLPETSFERNGLVSALEKKQSRQLLLREKAKALFALTPAGGYLQTVTLSTQKAALSYALADEKDIDPLKKRIASILKITSDKHSGKTWTVEGTYE